MNLAAPDVQRMVIDYLTEAFFPEIPVSDRMLDVQRFIRVVCTGGPGRRQRVLFTAQLTIDAYDGTPAMAGDLSREIDGLIYALPTSTVPVTSVLQGFSPGESRDPLRKEQGRYTATYQLTVKCS